MSGKQWALGDEADNVATVHGENKLKQFTEDINFDGVWTTLQRYRDVCRAFPKDRGRPRYFASAQVSLRIRSQSASRLSNAIRTSANVKRARSCASGVTSRIRLKQTTLQRMTLRQTTLERMKLRQTTQQHQPRRRPKRKGQIRQGEKSRNTSGLRTTGRGKETLLPSLTMPWAWSNF